MSVHQESLDMTKSVERMEEPPELEYSAVRNDSLAMFGAAIGGALLGMLLTLLVLAILNGGTLSFTGGERLAVFEASLARVDENVGAVSYNVDVVAQQAREIQSQLGQVEAALSQRLDEQDAQIGELGEAIAILDRTRNQFDVFVAALSDALSTMKSLEAEAAAPAEAAPAPAESAPAEAAPAEAVALPTPEVATSADVPAHAVAVVLFQDANGNGTLDEGEAPVTGVQVTLVDAAGETVAQEATGEEGVLFSELAAGTYQVTVEAPADLTLAVQPAAEVTVEADATEGHVVYVPVEAAAGE
uniref:SD-repeat containing protein B domain-containing protein n=2 Tax=Litorilinea aerophila TaxID=1204385 RepID=A0A540V8W5_9CHLR